MRRLSENEEKVGRYYDEEILDAEVRRLEESFPVEHAITRRCLERHVPAAADVADVGVGGGHYAELLARRGCRVHLVDVSARLLEAASGRLDRAGLLGRLADARLASATSLEHLGAGSLDAVLLLGPLYHLTRAEERKRAVVEASRILRPRGVLIAAGINRLAYLRELFIDAPGEVLARREFHAGYLRDGVVDPEHAPPIGHAHMTSISEFRDLFRPEFDEIETLAVESFATGRFQPKLKDLPPEQAEAWLDLIESTAAWPEAHGMTDHYLFVGRKKAATR